jgi:uncharacterized membrane protein (UPF0127 family)
MRNEREVARSQAWLAETFWARSRGLLGRPPLRPGEALKIAPCNSIHCFFMRVPIDVVFLNAAGVVLKVCINVRPWRGRIKWRAKAVVELAAGEASRLGLQEGDLCR